MYICLVTAFLTLQTIMRTAQSLLTDLGGLHLFFVLAKATLACRLEQARQVRGVGAHRWQLLHSGALVDVSQAARQPEAAQLDAPILVQQDVGGLEVAVDNGMAVQVLQRGRLNSPSNSIPFSCEIARFSLIVPCSTRLSIDLAECISSSR